MGGIPQTAKGVHKDNVEDSRSMQVVELALRCENLSVAILSSFTAAKSEAILIR